MFHSGEFVFSPRDQKKTWRRRNLCIEKCIGLLRMSKFTIVKTMAFEYYVSNRLCSTMVNWFMFTKMWFEFVNLRIVRTLCCKMSAISIAKISFVETLANLSCKSNPKNMYLQTLGLITGSCLRVKRHCWFRLEHISAFGISWALGLHVRKP